MRPLMSSLQAHLLSPLPLLRARPTAASRRKVRPRAVERESPLFQLQEFLGATGNDPGHWNYSPEWFGTQDGGWGRDAGQQVFCAESAHGNGMVTVTAHEASHQEASPPSIQEWRVLRFNGITRQSVARVTLTPAASAAVGAAAAAAAAAVPSGGSNANGNSSSSSSAAAAGSELGATFLPSTASNSDNSDAVWSMAQQADCLAPEYLKSMASLAAALIGLQGLLPRAGTPPGSQGAAASSAAASSAAAPGQEWLSAGAGGAAPGEGPLRVLCIGLGGGVLPLFLSQHFPLSQIDAVELDPVVVAAATLAMGLPSALPNLRLHTADAYQFVADFVARQQAGQQAKHEQQEQLGQEQEQQQYYDLVFLDAFDGADNVPEALCSADFAGLLAEAVHPRHGTVLINMHNKDPGRPILLPGFILGRSAPPGDLGYDPKSSTGQRIMSVAATFAAALRGWQREVRASRAGAPEAVSGNGSRGSSEAPGGAGSAGAAVRGGVGVPVVRAFTVSVAKQLNVEVVVARGLGLDEEAGPAALQLGVVGAHVADLAGYRFPAGKRACRGFCNL